MPSAIELEIGLTLEEFRAMTKDERLAKSAQLSQVQIDAFNKLVRDEIAADHWKQRNEGTYPWDVEMREFLINEIVTRPIRDEDFINVDTFGRLFEDYITTYPVNVSMFGDKVSPIGAYGGILNFELLNRAIDEILEVAFDKFGYMLEWVQTWDYLTPTHSMISSAMRMKMPEYQTSSNSKTKKV